MKSFGCSPERIQKSLKKNRLSRIEEGAKRKKSLTQLTLEAMIQMRVLLPIVLLVVGCSSGGDTKGEKEITDSTPMTTDDVPIINNEVTDEPPNTVLSPFDNGEALYGKRAEKVKGVLAEASNIDDAISFYEQASPSAATTAALLRAYEFKGHFTPTSSSEKEKIYEKAIALGESELAKSPDHVGLRYYYVSNLARWGQEVGVIEASKNGLLGKIKEQAELILEKDADFGEAGAERILGAMHLRVPKIPFVLKWPSKEIAFELLGNAYNSHPENPANVMLYAEALIENKQEERAQNILKELVSRQPRRERLLEDLNSLDQAKALYKQEFQ